MQTLAPGAPSIARAARHDTAGFLAEELERRRALRYPPFSHLVRIGLASPDERRLENAAGAAREALEPALPRDAELLGPAPMFRVRDRHRRRLMIKADADQKPETVAAVREVVERLARDRALREVATGVDVDPQ